MTLEEILRERWGEDADDILRDITNHGADAGFAEITYYSDTDALYRAHADEIWAALAEDADDMGLAHPLALVATFGGAANVGSDVQLANLLVWYAVERIAYRAQD